MEQKFYYRTMIPSTTAPPTDPDALLAAIGARYNDLSKRLKQIARFALDHRHEMALETIAVLARRVGVQPSSLVRFAKAFGYSGFSEMQRVMRTPLVARAPDYSQRIKARSQLGGDAGRGPAAVLSDFVSANTAALRRLPDEAPAEQLAQALSYLAKAKDIHVLGQRRAFPVAAYLAYALSHLGLRVRLVDSLAGMLSEQASMIRTEDTLLAVTYHPYSQETVRVVTQAKGVGAGVVAVTDSLLSPIGSLANVCFAVQEADVHGFRSLTSSIGLAQCLFIALGYELNQGSTPPADDSQRW